MRNQNGGCPIWGPDFPAKSDDSPLRGIIDVYDSPRAGGPYQITYRAVDSLDRASSNLRARLTTWPVDQRIQGGGQPHISLTVVDRVKANGSLPAHERAYRLLRLLARQIGTVGQSFDLFPYGISKDSNLLAAYAWSESTEWHEITYLFEYLLEEGFLQGRIGPDSIFDCTVTVNGYRHIGRQVASVDSAQAFIAMWFNDSTDNVYEDGIKAGVKDAGFNPRRIDRKDHINKIEDEIIAEIRRSRFLVADFTHGEDGARGGVYYEAGFAHGLGLPVIFTCHQDSLETLHFDTSHYNHIVWTEPEELRQKLKNRILAVIVSDPMQGTI